MLYDGPGCGVYGAAGMLGAHQRMYHLRSSFACTAFAAPTAFKQARFQVQQHVPIVGPLIISAATCAHVHASMQALEIAPGRAWASRSKLVP